MSEADRVLPASHKSAELVKAENRTTSAVRRGSVSEPARRSASEPMSDASVENGSRQRGCGRLGLRARGALGDGGDVRPKGARPAAHQFATETVVVANQIPHGVESVSKAGEGSDTEPKNLAIAPSSPRMVIEATGDRDGERRSPRSSPRAGKPLTRRRGTVGTACKQEADECPTR